MNFGTANSTKISGNSCSKSNGTENFGKFVSKISVHLSRLSFFLEIWKFRKFPVPFGISTGYESARSFSREKLQDGERVFRVHTTLDAKWSAIVRACSWSPFSTKTLGSDFLENCGLVVPNFLWVSSRLYTPPREKFVSFSHKYQGRVEFWMRAKLLHMKQLTALKTATSSLSFSILSSNSWWEMCSSGNRTRSVRPGGKYRSIRHTKISEIQTRIFGRMERAPVPGTGLRDYSSRVCRPSMSCNVYDISNV